MNLSVIFFLDHAEEPRIFALKRGKGKRIPYKPPYLPRGYEVVANTRKITWTPSIHHKTKKQTNQNTKDSCLTLYLTFYATKSDCELNALFAIGFSMCLLAT